MKYKIVSRPSKPARTQEDVIETVTGMVSQIILLSYKGNDSTILDGMK